MEIVDELLAGVCAGVDAATAKTVRETRCLTVDEVPFTLSPGAETDPDGLYVYCELGELPPGEAGTAALRRLLELNLCLFRPGAPTFGVDAEGGGAVLMTRLVARDFTPPRLLAALAETAALARAWQATHFADGSLAVADMPDFAATAASSAAAP